jgi:hypothetical protein
MSGSYRSSETERNREKGPILLSKRSIDNGKREGSHKTRDDSRWSRGTHLDWSDVAPDDVDAPAEVPRGQTFNGWEPTEYQGFCRCDAHFAQEP